jgi:hypothetical protein
MATATRVYIVSTQDGTNRLVRATVASQAITHVAKSAFTAKVASQDDLILELRNGTKVETCGETAQDELITE